jgi:hypothetical protein
MSVWSSSESSSSGALHRIPAVTFCWRPIETAHRWPIGLWPFVLSWPFGLPIHGQPKRRRSRMQGGLGSRCSRSDYEATDLAAFRLFGPASWPDLGWRVWKTRARPKACGCGFTSTQRVSKRSLPLWTHEVADLPWAPIGHVLWIGSLSGQFAGSILNWWPTGSERSALEKMICVAGAAWSRVDSSSYQE